MNAADLALHLRLTAGDKTALDECVVRWLPELVQRLTYRNPSVAARDDQLIASAALDALFDYTLEPDKYDPERSSLAYYLLNAAQRDLINALAREKTQSREASSINLVEFSLPDRNNMENDTVERVDAAALMEQVMKEITDPLDRRMLALMLQGERATAAYATVLGIEDLPDHEQKIRVKRHKDRISKRLERLGESIRG
jgi:RNA polymerase sigma-70 factor (ECF subfamily)